MIGPSVFTQLKAITGRSLANSDGTFRIYPNYVRQDDKLYPQLVYDCDNYQPDTALDGATGIADIDVRVLAIGKTYDAANTLGKQISDALDATRGTWGSTVISGCFIDEVSEDHFVDTDLETILFYQKELTFKVTFQNISQT